MDNIGVYALAERVSGIPLMLIWQPFSQYWMVESFKYHQEGNQKAFNVVFCIVCATLFIAGLGISLFASPVIHVMSSKAFYPAASAVPLLVLGATFACLANFASFSFLVTENTKVLGAYSYVTAGVVSVLYVVLIPSFGYMGAAAAMAAAQGVQLLITYVHGRRHYDMNLSISFLLSVTGVTAAAYVLGNLHRPNVGFAIDLAVRSLCWLAASLLIVYWLLHDASIRAHALEVIPARLRPLLRRWIRDPKVSPKGQPLT
jgi:O-antigen/teichoic acid export membrane protein